MQNHNQKQQQLIDKMIEQSLIELSTTSQQVDNAPNSEQIPVQPNHPNSSDAIDPLQELTQNNNILPLLAIIDQIDLTADINGVPLLSLLCTKHIPLASHLHSNIQFKPDADNRTALHYAIEADDVVSANWCLQNGIPNSRDNFGNTAILDAIRLGRRRCFLLCLHYGFNDQEAPHWCARYNRVWELQVLNSLDFNIANAPNHQNQSPLEEAVKSYSFEAGEYLTKLGSKIEMEILESKTDSKAMMRRIRKAKSDVSFYHQKLIPFAWLLLNVAIVYFAIKSFPFYQPQQTPLLQTAYLWLACLCLSFVFSWLFKEKKKPKSNLMTLLQAPEYPVLENICAECLRFQETRKQHCFECGQCVPKLHFHSLFCVNRSNEVFWIGRELIAFYLLVQLNGLCVDEVRFDRLIVNNFSGNMLFEFGIILETLSGLSTLLLCWFIYLKIFVVYQFLRLFEIFYMMVLSRTSSEVNHTEKHKHLYRIVQAQDNSYKNQQIRLLQKGFAAGLFAGMANVVGYFFK